MVTDFKIGDIVKTPEYGVGYVCDIIHEGNKLHIGVRVKNNSFLLHDCNGKCPQGHGRYYLPSKLVYIGKKQPFKKEDLIL